MKCLLLRSLTISTLALLVACASAPSDSGSDSSASSSFIEPTARGLVSTCGSVVENELKNPVDTGENVLIQAVAPDLFVITRTEGDQAGNQQIVKLQGVSADGVNSTSKSFGMDLINQVLAGEGIFVSSGSNCPVSTAAGQGVLGHIYSIYGESISELMLEAGSVRAVVDSCGGDLLNSCYSSFTPVASDETISDFLWKPESDSDGNLVVLVDPYDVTIVVRGAITETLRNVGPGNGRGTQSRAKHPGCSYGGNIRVEFYDYRGLRIKTASGADSITVANGCSRTEKRF